MANTSRTKPGEERIVTVQGPNPFEKIQNTYEVNQKPINTIVTIILIAVIGYFGYLKLYKAPRDEKAATAVSFAQRYFQADSANLALNGDGQHAGFLSVIKRYGGTNTANLCHYYAGVCYLHMGDFNNAVKYLKDFDGKGTLLEYQADGDLGDAYMELGNVQKGIEYYNKAVENKDDLLAPIYLYRAGLAYEKNNQPEEAKKAYITIRDNYPKSMQARDMDKYLAHLGVLNQ
ncbi:MAG: tetratricopeptide repeat protein [Flavipsychrobacter sp.]|nr:tetratricopeptide repeat protein [Flavipsychrobacter sp.]